MSSVTTSFRPRRAPAPVSDRVAHNRARLGRVVLVVVVLLMATSYVRPAVDWFSARSAAGEQATRLETLRQTQRQLEAEKARLTTARGMTQAVRDTMMVREGERAYSVTGLPKD